MVLEILSEMLSGVGGFLAEDSRLELLVFFSILAAFIAAGIAHRFEQRKGDHNDTE